MNIPELASAIVAIIAAIGSAAYAFRIKQSSVQKSELEFLMQTLDVISKENKRLSLRLDSAEVDLDKWRLISNELGSRVKELEKIEKTLTVKIASLENLNTLLQEAVNALVKERKELQKANLILLDRISELERKITSYGGID